MGNEKKAIMHTAAISELRMLPGGSASGPARNALAMTVKMSMTTVSRVQMTLDAIASGTGYDTKDALG